jgi:hypothetical protein
MACRTQLIDGFESGACANKKHQQQSRNDENSTVALHHPVVLGSPSRRACSMFRALLKS